MSALILAGYHLLLEGFYVGYQYVCTSLTLKYAANLPSVFAKSSHVFDSITETCTDDWSRRDCTS